MLQQHDSRLFLLRAMASNVDMVAKYHDGSVCIAYNMLRWAQCVVSMQNIGEWSTPCSPTSTSPDTNAMQKSAALKVY
jgi:hypothetical protein